jgi:hypothetical protein
MPKLSVWLLRASLLHMGVGFLFGACILYQKGNPMFVWSWLLLNPHIEIMLLGWTMQFVMGIAYWILPRFSSEPRYGKTVLGWWSFVLLNSGVFVAATGAWFALDSVALVGRLAALSAMLLFVVLIYPRVKPIGIYPASSNSQSLR